MKLDLDKFTDLADEVEEGEARGGKYSAIYAELDKAYETIAELIIGKKITHKRVIELLKQSGMTELKEHNFSGWWTRKQTKAKREKTEQQYAEAKAKKEQQKPVASVSDIRERSSAARASVKGLKAIDPQKVARVDDDIQIPWTNFVTRMKQNHQIGSDVISAVLQESGVLEHKDRRYTLLVSVPNLFPNLHIKRTLVFQNVVVWGKTLEQFVLSYVGDADRMAN
jgi:hypothetical protein